MYPFRYIKTTEVSAALNASATASHAVYIAGGTSLIDIMKLDVVTPQLLVDITALPLGNIEILADKVRIGALVSNSQLAYHPFMSEQYPLVKEAILSGASAQLRNMATVGGNLLQRMRCSYFRDTATACNKREAASGCSALHGYNRAHAILGTSPLCIAVHPSDMCVALAALDAQVQIQNLNGSRSIPLTELYRLPGDHPEQETLLEQGELITSIELPPSTFAAHSKYLKVRDRTSYAFALVSVAAALDIQDGIICDARIALGGVAPKPWRVYEAEQRLIGNPAQTSSYQKVAALATKEAQPQRYNAFKIELTQRAIVRALELAGGNDD